MFFQIFMMILIIKIVVAMTIVVMLSIIAENVSPKISGILAGYPLGTAIVLFFYGLEIGPNFASDSAFYTLLGLIASQSFVYFYYKISRQFNRFSIFYSSIISFSGFLFVAYILHFFNFTKQAILVLTMISIVFSIFLFRKISNIKINKKITFSHKILFARAGLAAFIVILITFVAKLVGEKWAGLFSAFPITLFPLILIVHFSYGKEHVHTIIKNFPMGLGALIIYSLSVYKLYPVVGIYTGTAISFLMATIYSFILLFFISWRKIITKY